MKPLLTVCCTSFNHGKYLRETLDGFLAQKTDFPIEIIIHDDASTDNCAAIIKEYAAKDNRIITILQTVNQYSQKIKPWHSYVFPKARGKYLALCEGDDYWTDPLKLQKQVDFLEANEDFAICFHDAKIYDETLKVLKGDDITDTEKEEFDLNDLSNGNFIHTPTVILRNDFTLPKDFGSLPIGDWPMYMLMLKQRKIKRISEEMAVYRVHSESSWSSKSLAFRLEKTIVTIEYLLEKVTLDKKQRSILTTTLNRLKRKVKKLNPSAFKKLKINFLALFKTVSD
ncbi:glycosyltransferase family 2 protein [Olleya sp. Bg11-27]|uniref:glycosyltransferase family 2 protein n=1 Tax=Olleya sp. Bg11-27 TaxID=2058135 RepID=UPI000C317DF4|nr:glycosyltransferase [Olleya sp. Bg11-27]AUC75607.1 glycosyl transferase family 2 [Olleya sp. Bg11-27]